MSVKAVFVGMPGSGKSTVGRLVAGELGIEFRDSDELIEEMLRQKKVSETVDETAFDEIEEETTSPDEEN